MLRTEYHIVHTYHKKKQNKQKLDLFILKSLAVACD